MFKNQVAIVTGAGQGIGFEICRQLAEKGAYVVLNDMNIDLANKAVAQINQEFGNVCVAAVGDASDEVFIQSMIDLAVKTWGKLTIAIANAGITLFGEFLTYSSSNFYKVLHTNLGGSFFLAQLASRQMIQQGNGGSILLMSSVTAHTAHKNLAAYSMTKAAIEMLAKNLIVEISDFGININTVAPGATMTERTAEDIEYDKTWSKITPLKRPATPADIAQAVLFLVSPQARHITGQSLVVDGGWAGVSPSPYDE